jgi:hypothetical protein
MPTVPVTRWRTAALTAAVLALALAGACSNYMRRSGEIRASLSDDDFEQALEHVEEIGHGGSMLLYLYERGTILHYQGNYEESNKTFTGAEALLEELYTKSVTREIAALAVTDNLAKYRGDPYEAVFVNYYQILNYLHMGDLEAALVECRQVNRKLQMILDAEESYFVDEPFLQYLTAMVYELAGDRTDAEVSYRVAAEGFERLGETYGVSPPPWLYCDGARNAFRLGDREEAEMYLAKAECPDSSATPRPGRVNLLIECGYVAAKVEENIVLPIFKNDDLSDTEEFAPVLASRHGATVSNSRSVSYWLRVALPGLVPAPVAYDHGEVRAVRAGAGPDTAAVATAPATMVQNVDAYAGIAFTEGYGRVLVRATARALIKYAAKEAADQKDEALGALVNLFGVVTESADTRSWSTLPQRVLMSPLTLPPGRYDLYVDLFDPAGVPSATLVIRNVEVRSGSAEFVNYRVF